MSKLILLSVITTFAWAGVLETQAESLGSAKVAEIYLVKQVRDVEVAKTECQEYSNSTYNDEALSKIAYTSCIENFKKILQKN